MAARAATVSVTRPVAGRDGGAPRAPSRATRARRHNGPPGRPSVGASRHPGTGAPCRARVRLTSRCPADRTLRWATTWTRILDHCADVDGAPLTRTPPRALTYLLTSRCPADRKRTRPSSSRSFARLPVSARAERSAACTGGDHPPVVRKRERCSRERRPPPARSFSATARGEGVITKPTKRARLRGSARQQS